MKKIIYVCDACQKEDTHPMALFKTADGVQWRINENPERADAHACSRECAKKIVDGMPIVRRETRISGSFT